MIIAAMAASYEAALHRAKQAEAERDAALRAVAYAEAVMRGDQDWSEWKAFHSSVIDAARKLVEVENDR